jgi:Anti-sigma-K factor rskA
VSHVDPEVLTLIALGEQADTPDARTHLAQCAHCQEELRALAEVVLLARQADDAGTLVSPPPQLWDRIAADTETQAGPGLDVAHEGDVQPRGSVHPRRTRRGWDGGWRRRPAVVAVAGAVAGLIIGVGGVAIAHVGHQQAPVSQVVGRSALRPLPEFPQWQAASGNAVMERGPAGLLLQVRVRAASRRGFFEVWLLARDGVSMISLGDLDRHHTGEFSVPPGTDLHNYSRIDVSLQPFNGSTAHSKVSVVRGALPG